MRPWNGSSGSAHHYLYTVESKDHNPASCMLEGAKSSSEGLQRQKWSKVRTHSNCDSGHLDDGDWSWRSSIKYVTENAWSWRIKHLMDEPSVMDIIIVPPTRGITVPLAALTKPIPWETPRVRSIGPSWAQIVYQKCSIRLKRNFLSSCQDLN